MEVSKGIRAIVYIDDDICAGYPTQEAEWHSAILQADLEGADFVLNLRKSKLTPHRVGEWLSFTVEDALLFPMMRSLGLKIVFQVFAGI